MQTGTEQMDQRATGHIIPSLKPIRRVVTGHDAEGNAIILENDDAKQILAIGVPTHGVTDLWKTTSMPADNEGYADPCTGKLTLPPPPNGTLFRIVEFPADRDFLPKIDKKAAFSALGEEAAESLTSRADVMMHRTASIDYAVVIEGEIWAVMDKGEARLQRGDVLIQRGTNHGWSNRGDKPALVAFVLVAAEPLKR
jgi:hypothetical protein